MTTTLKHRVFPVLLFVSLLVSACTPAVDATPSATAAPTEPAPAGIIAGRVWRDVCQDGAGCVRIEGQLMPDGIEAADEIGLDGVLIELGVGSCPSIGLDQTRSGPNGTYLFPSLAPGTYCVSVNPGAEGNLALLGESSWTHPSYGQGSAQVSVTLLSPDETRLVSFGRALAQAATPTPALTVTPAPTTTTACTNAVGFVADVTVPDNSRFEPNRSFDKTWRLRNNGSCTWTTAYDLVFVSGHRLNGPVSQTLPRSVPPGGVIDLTLRFKSPADDGFYRGYWLLQDETDRLFGLGDKANAPFWLQIVVGQLGTTSSGAWRGEYFARRDLSGSLGFVRNDPVVDFDWKSGSPGSPLGADNFSARWTGKASFEAGTYRFRVRVDDGVRLYVDERLVIDSWRDGSVRTLEAEVALTKGTHSIRLEYYERAGDARVQLNWSRVSKPTFADWKGEYWNNRDLSGSPALIRNDRQINFNWGSGSPAVGLTNDNFSARWTRSVNFADGDYRFTVRSDDGVRIWVGGNRILNEWHDNNASVPYTVDVHLSGTRDVRVEYYERAGAARVEVAWAKLEATPTPTATVPGPTLTPTATEPAPTETPTATEPAPTETSVPDPVVVYNFADSACDASWSTGAGSLPCPTSGGGSEGAVYSLNDPSTEAGGFSGLGLVTEPESAAVGVIQGVFPGIQVHAGDRFRASIGCLAGNPSCQVEFQLLARVGGSTTSLGAWTETFDGGLHSLDLNLSAFAGQTVQFILAVHADGSAAQNGAIWLAPRLMR